MDLVWNRLDEGGEKVGRYAPGGFFVLLDESELGGAVDGREQIQPALLSADLGDIDMEATDRVRLELFAGRPIAFDLGQPRNAVALKAAVERGAGQVGNGGLERVQAVVERQKRVPAKGHDHGSFFGGKHGGTGLLGAGFQIGRRVAPAPLGDRLRVHAMALG